MDKLHLLLADAATLEDNTLESMAMLFSLPPKVINKELAVLQSYGIGQLSEDSFSLSQRGAEVLTTWKQMNKTGSLEVETSAKLWLLGTGSFSVPQNVRCFESCQELARQKRIESTEAAACLVRLRQKQEIELAKFLDFAPTSWSLENPDSLCKYADVILATLEMANDDESIDKLQHLLVELFDRQNKISKTGDPSENNGEEHLRAFECEAKRKRQENRAIAVSNQLCVPLLLGDWLCNHSKELFPRFAAEPGAFVFTSSVPVVLEQEKPKPKPKIARQSRRKKKGFLRSLLRLFTD